MAERRRELWWAAGFLVALIAAVFLILPPGAQVATDQRLSSYRTSPDGAGAVFETLALLDVPVARRVTPLVGAEPIQGPMAILSPTEPLSPAEVAAVVEWLEDGGRLIVASAGFDPLMDELGLTTRRAGIPGAELVPGTPHPWTDELEAVGPAQRVFADTIDPAWQDVQPLLVVEGEAGDRDAVAALLARRGQGAVLALSDPALLSNGRIADGGIAPLVARAAAEWTADGRPLWFDEYHHGYRGGSLRTGLRSFLTRHPAGRATIHLALIGLLGIVAAAIRMGRPVEMERQVRRSPVEHVAALGEAYRQAGADEVARRRLVAGFARRIGRERPRRGSELAFLEGIQRRVPTGGDTVGPVVEGWRDQVDVLELARRIDRAVNRLSGDR